MIRRTFGCSIRDDAHVIWLGTAGGPIWKEQDRADIRFDRAMVLILVTALLNIAVDVASRRIRARLRLKTSFDAA